MEQEPTIMHADVDSFFASVEQRRDPSLRGRAVIVGVGVVMAASYEAKACGVHGGMIGGRARQLCPRAIAVEPHFSDYGVASRELFDLFRDTAPLVEGLSMEEAFLDVSGLRRISGSPVEIAERLRRRVREELSLPISIGIARTKTLAKMASRAAKPDGLLVVPADGEREFLHPLPISAIWGVGEATARRIDRLGVRTVGDLAAVPEASLTAALGRHAGTHLHALASLRERRPVRPRHRRRTFGSQSALGRRCRSRDEVDLILARLVDRVSTRMRSKGRTGRTVVLRLRFGDYRRASRSRTLPRATAASAPLLRVARRLLDGTWPATEARGLTLIGVTVSGLDDEGVAGVQLELPLEQAHPLALDEAIDELDERFGAGAVTRGPPSGRETEEPERAEAMARRGRRRSA